MRKALSRIAVATALSCLSVAAAAETIIEEVWTCELEEGKTLADVQAVNSKWLAFVNDKAGDGKIRSSVVRAVVGNTDIFMFVDSYPDLATWSATKKALATEEGQAFDEAFGGLSDCSENRLYSREFTE